MPAIDELVAGCKPARLSCGPGDFRYASSMQIHTLLDDSPDYSRRLGAATGAFVIVNGLATDETLARYGSVGTFLCHVGV
ncbi:hypothetical protein GCD22_02536 [Acidithiobacillus thiooxidans ATCC 19377]|uniref:Uncharacterized protein n=1 Tax=Acidithiobacillus thiooxidans ATCC 19377 TaxID=637390 RepID=A0A5P9XRS7_ACITH|nr:hypothetical protein GCD22_02536 [Acidithiobacillus thiooxidans ATCC 19377]